MRFYAPALVLLTLAACHRNPVVAPKPTIIELKIVQRPGDLDLPRIEIPHLEQQTRAWVPVETSLAVATGAAKQDGYRLRIEVAISRAHDPQSQAPLIGAMVRAQLEPVSLSEKSTLLPYEEAALTSRPLPTKVTAEFVEAFVDRSVHDVLSSLGRRVRLQTGTIAELQGALTGTDPELQRDAIVAAGERNDHALVPALIKILTTNDREVRDLTIGALQAIGDPRAIKPLTELAQFRDTEELPIVIDAVSTIGGDEAKAYLDFVAAGHDDPEIRALAKRAAEHMAARSKGR